ncbi:MAG: pirin family protein [Planctomycetaceae bacterium]
MFDNVLTKVLEMIRIRKANERGCFDHGWLQTCHTFSFGDYRDPEYTSFRSLRVMNEDRVQPAGGFPTHPHRDMEIVTYVLEGALEHRDSMGNGSVIQAGDFQRMSAGTGITHSEFNASETQPVHLYQIWLFPERKGIDPSYEQMSLAAADKRDGLRLVASHDGRDGSLTIHQDANIFLSTLDEGRKVAHQIEPGRYAWLQVLRGHVTLNGNALQAGDGAAVSDEESLMIEARSVSEVMLFDLN